MNELQLYTDGGSVPIQPRVYAGTWAFVVVRNDTEIHRSSGVIPVSEGFNGSVPSPVSELAAMVFGLEYLQSSFPAEEVRNLAHVYSDSEQTLQRVFIGGTLNSVPAWLIQRLRGVRKGWTHKGGKMVIPYTRLDAHPTTIHLETGVGKNGNPVSVWNKLCDKLCKQEAKRYAAELQGVEGLTEQGT